jgi:hypothetical protein
MADRCEQTLKPVLHEDAGPIKSGKQTPTLVSAEIDVRRIFGNLAFSVNVEQESPVGILVADLVDIAGDAVVVLVIKWPCVLIRERTVHRSPRAVGIDKTCGENSQSRRRAKAPSDRGSSGPPIG